MVDEKEIKEFSAGLDELIDEAKKDIEATTSDKELADLANKLVGGDKFQPLKNKFDTQVKELAKTMAAMAVEKVTGVNPLTCKDESLKMKKGDQVLIAASLATALGAWGRSIGMHPDMLIHSTISTFAKMYGCEVEFTNEAPEQKQSVGFLSH